MRKVQEGFEDMKTNFLQLKCWPFWENVLEFLFLLLLISIFPRLGCLPSLFSSSPSPKTIEQKLSVDSSLKFREGERDLLALAKNTKIETFPPTRLRMRKALAKAEDVLQKCKWCQLVWGYSLGTTNFPLLKLMILPAVLATFRLWPSPLGLRVRFFAAS